MEKTIFVGLVLGILATIAMATTSAMSTVYADKGGDPNNSDQAQQNAEEREDKKQERRDAYEADPKDNDHGKVISHKNMFDENGVQPVDDDDCEPPLCTDDGGNTGDDDENGGGP